MAALPRPPLAPLDTVLPDAGVAALLLDIDGTLLDIAPTPDTVVVPDRLIARLLDWRTRLGGALAMVTGRPIDHVDALFPDVPTAVAGEHGGAIRHRPDGPIERPFLPTPPASWYAAAQALADAHPGAVMEAKPRGLALHYRGAPSAGPALKDGILHLLEGQTDRFELLAARMAWEIRPVGADKGSAVARLMERHPFAGRLPVFIGDDVTDLDAAAVARRMGGAGLMVGEFFGDAVGVRAWLG